MLMKKPRHRVFDYTPRFYKPERDELNKKRKRIKFNSVRKYQKRKKSTVIWLVLIILILYIYLKLSGGT